MSLWAFIIGLLALTIVFATLLKPLLFRKERMFPYFQGLFSQNRRGIGFSALLTVLLTIIIVVMPFRAPVPAWLRAFFGATSIDGLFQGELTLFEFVALFLAVGGSVFAVLARVDAKAASKKSDEIRESIASFRVTFSQVMGAIPDFIKGSQHSLYLMIPTPFYGFLFNEETSSKRFAHDLRNKLDALQDASSTLQYVGIILINPRNERGPQSHSYLRRA